MKETYTGIINQLFKSVTSDVSFQFLYGNEEDLPNAVAVQMKLLQLLSKESYQNVTYHCKNSVAVQDEQTKNLKKSMVLKGANGQDLRAQGNTRMRYTVIEDGCSVKPQSFLKFDQNSTLQIHQLPFLFFLRQQMENGARQ